MLWIEQLLVIAHRPTSGLVQAPSTGYFVWKPIEIQPVLHHAPARSSTVYSNNTEVKRKPSLLRRVQTESGFKPVQ